MKLRKYLNQNKKSGSNLVALLTAKYHNERHWDFAFFVYSLFSGFLGVKNVVKISVTQEVASSSLVDPAKKEAYASFFNFK